MGVYVEGELDVELSRKLTPGEVLAWESKVKAGRQEPAPCGNSSHQGAPLNRTGHDEKGNIREPVCEHFDSTPGTFGFCYVDSERFDPDGWDFTGESWGDVGIAELGDAGFTIRSGGKVYDVEDAAAFFVESLPADVLAHGEGFFTSDGWDWGILVHDRAVLVGDVSKKVVLPEGTDPRGD